MAFISEHSRSVSSLWSEARMGYFDNIRRETLNRGYSDYGFKFNQRRPNRVLFSADDGFFVMRDVDDDRGRYVIGGSFSTPRRKNKNAIIRGEYYDNNIITAANSGVYDHPEGHILSERNGALPSWFFLKIAAVTLVLPISILGAIAVPIAISFIQEEYIRASMTTRNDYTSYDKAALDMLLSEGLIE